MLIYYLKIAWRNILKHKFYFFLNVSGLAAGIACSMVIILYVVNEVTYDAHHPDADRVYRIAVHKNTVVGEHRSLYTSAPLAPLLRRQEPQVQAVARIVPPLENAGHVLVTRGEHRFFEKRVFFVDPELFDVLGFRSLQGESASALHQPGMIFITQSIAHKYFPHEPPLGQALRLELDYDTGTAVTEDFTIRGILQDPPANSHLQYDVLISMATMLRYRPDFNENWFEYPAKYTYVKLVPGADVQAFEKQLSSYAVNLTASNKHIRSYAYFLQPLRSIHLHSNLQGELGAVGSLYYMAIYGAVALLVLLIGCMNYINLSASLAATRTREVGIRKVAGSRRRDLVVQFLSESFILTFMAFLLASLLFSQLVLFFNAMANTRIAWHDLARPEVLCTLFFLFLVISLAAGGYPALILSGFKPISMLQNRFSLQGGRNVQRVLVLGQFVISIFLVVCTLVVFHQLNYMKGKSLGFERGQKIVLDIKSNQNYFRRNYEAIKTDLLSQSGIAGAAASSKIPGNLDDSGYYLWPGSARTQEKPVRLKALIIDTEFTSLYGITLAAGRPFLPAQTTDRQDAFVINEAGVHALGFKQPEEALGQQYFAHYNGKVGRIIGVTRDFHFMGMKDAADPMILDLESSLLRYLTIETAPGEVRAVLEKIEAVWQRHFPGVPFEYAFLDETFARVYRYEEQMGRLLGIVTGLGISIALLGLFGMVAFFSHLRRKEFGIRKVLGASISQIVVLMTRDYLYLILLAGLLAVPAAWITTQRWLQDFAYHITPGVPVFVFAFLATAIIALVVILYQGAQAARDNPADALRCE